jgi:RNA polymerase sigma-70 factor (ECF subfamily)
VVVKAEGARVEELEAVYRSGFESFVRVATVITHDAEAARDAVQAAFVAAIRGRGGYRGESALEGWVWRIVVNEARRAARTRLDADDLPEAVAANGHGGDDLGVRRYVAALPQRQREAVFLRYFADLDYRTIARVLDLEPGTVSATLSAAHQTLRKRLEATAR